MKKSVFYCALIIVFVTSVFPSCNLYADHGDVAPLGNPDGIITVGDAIVTLRIAVGMEQVTPYEKTYADVAPVQNELSYPDGRINVGDAIVILRTAINAHTIVVGKLHAPDTNSAVGTLILPAGTPLQLSNLKILTPSNETPVSGDGTFQADVFDQEKGQIGFIETETGETVFPFYIPIDQVLSGNVSITSEELAKGIILFNPFFLYFSPNERDDLVLHCSGRDQFTVLITEIESAFQMDPLNALNTDVFPQLMRLAMEVGIETLNTFRAKTIGSEEEIHFEDGSGNILTVVNPKTIFYGLTIDHEFSGETHHLIEGKANIVSGEFVWPPAVYYTPPVEENINLSDGLYTLYLYKGFNFDEPCWLSVDCAAGKATAANLVKSIIIALSAVVCHVPLDNDDIVQMINLISDLNLDGLNNFLNALQDNWVEALRLLYDEIIVENWDRIAYWIWQEWPSPETAEFLGKAGRVLGTASKVLTAIDAVNEWLPFFYDLVLAPGELQYTVSSIDGVLEETEVMAPPTAVFETSLPLKAQEDIVFDATESYDNYDPVEVLQVRWDFDGDDIWDTSWSFNKLEVHQYVMSGVYEVTLEVMDADLLVGRTVKFLAIEGCRDDDGDNYYAEYNCGTSVDCDDTRSSVNPGTQETCYNGLDDNCNGLVDENCDDWCGFAFSGHYFTTPAWWITSGDFNRDGKPDLVLTERDGYDALIYTGNGDGTFRERTTLHFEDATKFVDIGDFNRDGRQDLVVTTNEGTPEDFGVHIFQGTGSGSFTEGEKYNFFWNAPWRVVVGKIDGDAHQDIVSMTFQNPSVRFLIGQGDGTFVEYSRLSLSDYPAAVGIEDFDGDGHADLAVATTSSSTDKLIIFLGRGDATFFERSDYDLDDTAYDLAVADFNSDGHADLAVADHYTDLEGVTVFLGHGNGTFTNMGLFTSGGSQPWSVHVGDFDSDGNDDLVIPNHGSNNISILLGNGDGTFTDKITYPTGGEWPTSIAIGDFNRDSRIDLAVGHERGGISIFLNCR